MKDSCKVTLDSSKVISYNEVNCTVCNWFYQKSGTAVADIH